MKLIGGRRLMARWHDRCYARNCWCDDYQNNSNRHWRGVWWKYASKLTVVRWGIKNDITLISLGLELLDCLLNIVVIIITCCLRLHFWDYMVAFALVRPACFRWLALAPGNRPSGVFLWWHQNISTIQKQENIIDFNLKFYALNSTYRSVQHNMSFVEKKQHWNRSIQI